MADQVVERRVIQLEVNGAQLERSVARGSKALQGLDRNIDVLRRSLGGLGAAFGAAFALQKMIEFTDAAISLTNSLKAAGLAGQELADAQQRVFDIASNAGAEVESVAALYGNLTSSLKAVGASQEEIAEATDIVTKSLAAGGATAAEASAAVRQLGQALASGVLRGDEFNSMAENARTLTQSMADALKVTTGELRKMAEQGKLTADVVFKAILESGPQVNKVFNETERTIAQLSQSIENELLRVWTKLLEEFGPTALQVLKAAADHIGLVVTALGLLVGILTGPTLVAGLTTMGRLLGMMAAVNPALTAIVAAAAAVTYAVHSLQREVDKISGRDSSLEGLTERLKVLQDLRAKVEFQVKLNPEQALASLEKLDAEIEVTQWKLSELAIPRDVPLAEEVTGVPADLRAPLLPPVTAPVAPTAPAAAAAAAGAADRTRALEDEQAAVEKLDAYYRQFFDQRDQLTTALTEGQTAATDQALDDLDRLREGFGAAFDEMAAKAGEFQAALDSALASNPYAGFLEATKTISKAMQEAGEVGSAAFNLSLVQGLGGASQLVTGFAQTLETAGIENFELQKALAMATTVINSAQAVVGVLAQSAVLGPATIPLAAAISAMAGIQLGIIAAQEPPARAFGGIMSAGQPYRVGENSPELWTGVSGRQVMVPSEAGKISPLRGGGQPSIVIENHGPPLDVRETRMSDDQLVIVAVSKAVKASEQEFAQSLRSGKGTYARALTGSTDTRRKV